MVVAWPSEDLQTLPACPALVLIYSRPSHGTITEPLAIKEARLGTTMIRSSVAHAQLTEVVEHALPASIRVGRGKYRLLVLLVIYRDGESCNYFQSAKVTSKLQS